MKLLIIGKNGQLGWELVKGAKERGWALTGLDLPDQIKNKGVIFWETYPYCGGSTASWYDFARAIFKMAAEYWSVSVKRVVPIESSEYPTPARRPEYSVLDCSKLNENFGIATRPWEESLEEMIRLLLG